MNRRLVLLLALSLPMAGCLTDDDDRDSSDGSPDTSVVYDPFPKPAGPSLFPLDDLLYTFRFVELDSAGDLSRRFPEFPLFIRRRGAQTYAYSFQDTTHGLLLQHSGTGMAGGKPGTYIVGSFRGEETTTGDPVLWLPEDPRPGEAWSLGGGRVMELADAGATFLTEVILPEDREAAPIADGFQAHPAVRIRETAGDTVTVYHFRRGLGLLGLERSVGGILRAAGTLTSVRVRRTAAR